MKEITQKPNGFEENLGPFGPQLYDTYSGEPVSWGFKIISRMEQEKFEQLRSTSNVECCYPEWYVITKTLTRDEAIQKYGPVTNEDFGPRGGWRSITFGTTTFLSKSVRY